MKPNKKEIDCINYSKKIRENVVKRKLEKLRQNRTPIFLTPKGFVKHFWQDYSVTNKMLSIWKKIVFNLIVAILYLLAIPFVFIAGIYELLAGKNNAFNKQKKEIIELYLIDNEVSETKTFEQLWNDKGLRDWGIGYMQYSGYSESEQLSCLKYWFVSLYNKTENDFDDYYNKVLKRINEGRRKFYQENPNGHISMASPIQLLPAEFDKMFGNYKI